MSKWGIFLISPTVILVATALAAAILGAGKTAASVLVGASILMAVWVVGTTFMLSRAVNTLAEATSQIADGIAPATLDPDDFGPLRPSHGASRS